MDPRLLGLYEQELRYFRESAGEFAAAYPKIARRLSLDATEIADPYVERLIEATAFLSARVGLKLEAEYPRFTGQLLDVVYPGYLAPTPAMVVAQAEIDPADSNLMAGPVLRRGSGLRAVRSTGQGTYCEFRTAQDLRLWPLELADARYFTYAPDLPLTQHPAAARIKGGLRIRLRTLAGARFDQLAIDDLLLHLSGADEVAWQLLECALGDPAGVLVAPVGAADRRALGIHPLPADTIEAVGFAEDEALLPQTETGFSGFRLLQEYFAFPQRFQFLRLRGLAPALSRMATEELELVLLFSRGQATLEKLVSAANVSLHCVPAINLFPKRLDRIVVNEGVSQFHLLPDRTRPQDFEVHSVTGVTGYGVEGGSGGTGEQLFEPFYAAFHGSRSDHPAYYTLSREPREFSARQRQEGHRSSHIGAEVFLQIVDPQQAPFSGHLRQLAVSALCTNRDLPLLLPLNGDDLESQDSFAAQRIAVVRGPSRPVSPVVSHGLGWRVLDHLALNYLSLADASPTEGANALREVLMLYAVHQDDSARAQVRGLLSVRCRPVVRRLPMPGPIAFGRGLEITLEVDRAAFRGHSVFLFGAVMAQYLQRHVEVNHFVETVVQARGSEIMRWRPRCGSRPIL